MPDYPALTAKPAFVTPSGIRVWGNVGLARTRFIRVLQQLEQTEPEQPAAHRAARAKQRATGARSWRELTKGVTAAPAAGD